MAVAVAAGTAAGTGRSPSADSPVVICLPIAVLIAVARGEDARMAITLTVGRAAREADPPIKPPTLALVTLHIKEECRRHTRGLGDGEVGRRGRRTRKVQSIVFVDTGVVALESIGALLAQIPCTVNAPAIHPRKSPIEPAPSLAEPARSVRSVRAVCGSAACRPVVGLGDRT